MPAGLKPRLYQCQAEVEGVEATMSRTLIIAGCLLLALGVLLHFVPGALSWFGRLPGDIRIEGERSKVKIIE